jgi:hypothetical protein
LRSNISDAVFIADGASLGHAIRDILTIQSKKGFYLFLPESFEFVLLLSDYFDEDYKISMIRKNLDDVMDHRHSSDERYITAELMNKIGGYKKGKLPAFLYSNGKLDNSRMETILNRLKYLDLRLMR